MVSDGLSESPGHGRVALTALRAGMSGLMLILFFLPSVAQVGGNRSPNNQNPPTTSPQTPSPVQPVASPTISQPVTRPPDTRSLPAAVPQTGPVPDTLSIQDAIQLALKNNVATLLAAERVNEANALKNQSRAPLLPNISGTVSQESRTVNLAALGFNLPGSTFPTFVGPFNVFDARLNLVQTIFSLSAIRQYQVGKAGVRVAALQEEIAREQVASGAALAYLNAISTAQNVHAVQANLDLAQALFTLAQNQRNAGIATGVDVTRAETRVSQEQVAVAQAQTDANRARLELLRIIGLPLGSNPTLTDPLRFANAPSPSVTTAIAEAASRRPEIQVAEEQERVAGLERGAVRAELLPSAEFVANYGASGITPTNTDLPTRDFGVRINVPVFNGGLTQARIQQATSRQRQAELQLTDTRVQVEQDVRLAIQTLNTTAVAVQAAQQSVTLAERELQMARDRFSAGVGDNIEVINAQTALAAARESQVVALAQYNAARINLAAATGRAQEFRG